ncbi:MAG TPA: NAD(P)/FAD-dependent oxidoreductase [Terriglobales bacterium]|nr:NAD(P)/FAD-dependent oxidoreductase [Terriglobales bacterium]
MTAKQPRVIIVGAGFGGLNAAQGLAASGADVEITIIDRKNHHTFQPLLYQVALAVLSPAEIASPIRGIFRKHKNVEVLLGEVVGFDLEKQQVFLKDSASPLEYDYLIVAAGATHAYFGHDEWAGAAPGLKTLEDALEIRRRVLTVFEQAERKAAAEGKQEELNFVVIGAGPTGVELAGAIADIAHRFMQNDFRAIDPEKARVILLEGGPRVLAAYTEKLSASAERQLRELGVEVRTSTLVTKVEAGRVFVGEEIIPAAVTLWAAGVAASPLGKKLSAKTDRAGRVQVGGDLALPEHRNVFVIGDLATYPDEEGKPVPGVAPAAIQMGQFVAKAIQRDLERDHRGTFHYWDKGSLATIGRTKGVGQLPFGIELSGFLAWMAWLGIHLYFLIGFRNRFFVLLDWLWAYLSFQKSARLITDK